MVGGNAEDKTGLAGEDARFLTLRVSTDEVPDRGEVVDLVIEPDRVHLFDIATGDGLGG